MDRNDYARASALIVRATLIKGIEANFPTLTMIEQDAILLDILNRLVLRMGWTIRPNGVDGEEGE